MELTFSNLLLAPMTICLALIILCWFYYELIRTGSVKSVKPRIYRCAVCQHVYADPRDVPLARCPRCGCLNEAVRR